MSGKNGNTHRRGQPRDDQAVLAGAHAAPKPRNAQVYATGETREGREVFRTTRFYGLVFLTIVEAYLATHAPVPCETCKEAVFAHSEKGRKHSNPFAVLAQLERPGLLQVDDGTRDSDRLPRVDNVIVELDDGTVLWPKAAATVSARAPSGASELTSEEFASALSERFVGREFASRDVLAEIPGAGKSTVYDRLRRLQEKGVIRMVGGTRGSRQDPPRFRFAESVPVEPVVEPTAQVASPPAQAAAPVIKSKEDLHAEISALTEEIAGADRETRDWEARCREADARVSELERQLEEATAHRRDVAASKPEPKDVAPIVALRERLRLVADNYDLLYKSD